MAKLRRHLTGDATGPIGPVCISAPSDTDTAPYVVRGRPRRSSPPTVGEVASRERIAIASGLLRSYVPVTHQDHFRDTVAGVSGPNVLRTYFMQLLDHPTSFAGFADRDHNSLPPFTVPRLNVNTLSQYINITYQQTGYSPAMSDPWLYAVAFDAQHTPYDYRMVTWFAGPHNYGSFGWRFPFRSKSFNVLLIGRIWCVYSGRPRSSHIFWSQCWSRGI